MVSSIFRSAVRTAPQAAKLWSVARIQGENRLASHCDVTAGTLIDTSDGPVNAANLMPSSTVRTLDNGACEVLSVEELTPNDARSGAAALVWAGVLGNPKELLLSVGQRVLIRNPWVEVFFGEPEVICDVRFLLKDSRLAVPQNTPARFYRLGLAAPQVLASQGVGLQSSGVPDRMCLREDEALVLFNKIMS